MHPIERLRYVARASGADPSLVAREAAGALAEVAMEEPAGLVPACRRLIGRHLTSGPVWWLSARMLGSDDPDAAAREAISALDRDRTGRVLVDELPEEATVVIIGWPDTAASALRRRGDVEVLVVDAGGEGSVLARRLVESGTEATVIPDAGVAAAAAVTGVVLIEAHAAGPSGILATAGSHAAAAVAVAAGIPVWAVTPVGTVLPGRLWDTLLSRVDAGGLEPWERDTEMVPASLLSVVAGPGGLSEVDAALRSSDAPPVAELLRDPR
ncbi:hypothetical protein K6U06_21945 [Acidiferrimicrobium sp. IK]|uniref:hypothetical protein n=1 Tax=Acidiferrimicrobium sp. IK TaxID=2871700 RepID=UPI0021CB4CEA|nr:hypothetical protein [Acidiferrimicrobium sp. IK]MCU4187043.1 hypothetical protein [Acidiferrimicrobium sp. IK]